MKESTIVQSYLDKLWATFIENMEFDLLRSEIVFQLKSYVNEEKWNHYTLKFSGVSSFYFANGTGDSRFNIIEYEDGNVLELSSISYCPKGIGKIHINNGSSWTKQYFSSANFVLGIWQRSLLIEAKQVEVVNIDENVIILRQAI